ncbi:MAG: Abortive infection protein [Planctomycetaceae bacterium]|nr:Abortive infection protein [Planctomycetaceae bacterium]
MFVQWRNVKLILLRELRDQLRDRRTLFMVFVLPLLLYPTLGIGMLQLTMLFTEQSRTIVVLGEESLPPPPLLNGDRFVRTLFLDANHAAKLRVITASDILRQQQERIQSAVPETSEEERPTPSQLLISGREIQSKLATRNQHRLDLMAAVARNDEAETTRLRDSLSQIQTELSEMFANSGIQVLVIIPERFDKNVERVNLELADRTRTGSISDYPRPVIVYNKADEKSSVAYQRVTEAMNRWEDRILEHRLELAGLPKTLPDPVKPIREDLASESQLSAMMWSKLFPALLVIMSMTGAFYPAIDLCAGEKERGTMETLLICPAKRIEIVLGKFFTVLSFSISTALLNLISIGMTGAHMATLAQRMPGAHGGTPGFPPLHALAWIIVLLLPLAAMFSALCLSLATFARSSKEGQYYLTPLLMFTLGLTVFCGSPGMELTPFYSIMPIAGVALLLKGLLLNPQETMLYWYAIPVLTTSIGYSLLALWWSIDQFQREDVLFREAERFELRLWLRHLMRDKEATPSFTHAVFCFVTIMMLQFASFRFLANATITPSGELDAVQTLKVMMVQQLALIASPALMMGIMLTTSMWQTFRFRLPSIKMIALALGLALAAHPLSLMLAVGLQWFFPPLPDGIARLMEGMGDPKQPLWMILMAFALAPAFCEEVAFRGFILSGFARSGRAGLAIVLSSLAFGIMHMIPQQVFNAGLLGLLLGLIAIRSNSLWPGFLFHFAFNSLSVLHGRLGRQLAANPDNLHQNTFFYTVDGQGHVLYQWPTLVIAGTIFVGLIYLLVAKQGASGQPETIDSIDSQPLMGNVAMPRV